jgi:hypothetical protein
LPRSSSSASPLCQADAFAETLFESHTQLRSARLQLNIRDGILLRLLVLTNLSLFHPITFPLSNYIREGKNTTNYPRPHSKYKLQRNEALLRAEAAEAKVLDLEKELKKAYACTYTPQTLKIHTNAISILVKTRAPPLPPRMKNPNLKMLYQQFLTSHLVCNCK